MKKTPKKHFAKRPMPAGSRRVTKPDGSRVWVINGREFESRRNYWEAVRAAAEKAKAALSEAQQETADPASLTIEGASLNPSKL